jgi:mRNA interferase YafQ
VSRRIVTTSRFAADIKRIRKTLGREAIYEIIECLDLLAREGALPSEYDTHALREEYAGESEFHVRDDLLIIYHFNDNESTLVAVRAGSHSELFL